MSSMESSVQAQRVERRLAPFAASIASSTTTQDDSVDDWTSPDAEDAKPTTSIQLTCSDGSVFTVQPEEAMASNTLWTLMHDVPDKKAKGPLKKHTIPVFDVPSESIRIALDYCRCLYAKEMDGDGQRMVDWEAQYVDLDSKTLCDVAKVASHLDIQSLVDLTCGSIEEIMFATEAADEIKQKFGLEDTDNCDLRSEIDIDLLNAFEPHLDSEEYEFVELEQPSVDELVEFINGDANKKDETTSKKKRKKKRRQKKAIVEMDKPKTQDTSDTHDADESNAPGWRSREVAEKVRLAQQDPSAVFQESQFEDEDDSELAAQLERFRRTLDSAHRHGQRTKPKLRLDFAPQDVFRSTLAASQ